MHATSERPSTSTRYRTLYHVTHETSIPSIRRLGLLPSLSTRRKKRVWLADLLELPWALRHVCATHNWRLDEVRILRATLDTRYLIRYRPGVFYVEVPIPRALIGACVGTQY